MDVYIEAGVSSLGVPWVPWHPQILADQLTLSQPGGGRLCPPNNTGIPGFSDLPTALMGSFIFQLSGLLLL